MARIQVLELPVEQVGEYFQTPFVLVFSEVDGTEISTWTGDLVRSDVPVSTVDALEALKESSGARAVLVYPGVLEVG